MSFLRVNDLLLVCIVQYHDGGFAVIYYYKYVFIGNKQEIGFGKVCLLVVEGFGSLVFYVKTENDVNFVSAHGSHYAQIWLNGVDIQNSTSILSCLSTLFWCTLWLDISPI